MRLAAPALALAFLLAVPAAGTTPDSMYRFGPAHEGRAPGKAVVIGGQAWRFATGGKVRSTPVVSESVAFFGSEDGHAYAVNLKDGREVWRFQTGAEVSSSPALSDGRVFFMSRDGVLRALDAQNGRELWRLATGPDAPVKKGDYRVGWDLWLSSPTVDGGTVYVGGGDGKVYAVEAATGKSRWSFQTQQRVRSCPALKDGTLFVGSFDGFVYALDAVTGRERWKFDTREAIQSSPAVAEGTVFIGSRSAAVFALDAQTGALKWKTRHPNGSWVLGSPAVAQGKVIVGSSDEQFLHALDMKTGQEVWRLDTRYRMLGSPVIAGDVVLCGSEGAHILAIDLQTGLLLGMNAAEGPIHTSPLPTGDLLLVGSDDKHLHAFQASPAPDRSPAEEAKIQACAGTYELRPGLALTFVPTKGFLHLKPAGLPPAMVLLGADNRLRCSAFGLELKAEFPGNGQPARLSRISPTGETPLKRLP